MDPSTRFTLEREEDRHLPFLDLNVYRGEQGNLETSVYRKPTHTDKYFAFDSHHPICHKNSVAKTLLRRTDCLPSSLDSKAEERKYVSNVLKANGYTKTFFFYCQKPVTTSRNPDEREPATGFAVISCIQDVTEPIKRILHSHNLKVARKPFQTLVHIFAKPKDPVMKEQRTLFILFHAMAVITITSDRDHFGTRLKEHQKAVFCCKKENSAFSEHTCLTNHTIGWDNSKIITSNRRYHRRLCLKYWHINSAHAPFNRDDGGRLTS